jgi:hypothetical protein
MDETSVCTNAGAMDMYGVHATSSVRRSWSACTFRGGEYSSPISRVKPPGPCAPLCGACDNPTHASYRPTRRRTPYDVVVRTVGCDEPATHKGRVSMRTAGPSRGTRAHHPATAWVPLRGCSTDED